MFMLSTLAINSLNQYGFYKLPCIMRASLEKAAEFDSILRCFAK